MNSYLRFYSKRVVLYTFTAWLLLAAGSELGAQCLQGSFTPGQLYKSTRNLELDRAMNEEATLIAAVLGVNPNMFLFDDGRAPNAYASSENTLAGYTGTVYFGVGLLRNELWSMNKGGYAVAGIMAHEFAHVLQATRNCRLSGKLRELHADYLAGYYLGRKNYIAPVNIQAFAASLYEKGDYAFWSPLHHGTPDERVQAMVAGLQVRDLSLTEAYRRGEEFVSGESEEESEVDNDESRDVEEGVDEEEQEQTRFRPHSHGDRPNPSQEWEEITSRRALRDVDVEYMPNWGDKRSGTVTARITLTNNAESASYKLRFKVAVVSVSRDDPDDVLGEVDSEVKTIIISAGESVVVPVKLRWSTEDWQPDEEAMPSFRGPDDEYGRLKAWRSEIDSDGGENEEE